MIAALRRAAALGLLVALVAAAPAAHAAGPTADTLSFDPTLGDSAGVEAIEVPAADDWLRPSIRDHLLESPDKWAASEDDASRFDPLIDYNRVDRLRLGGAYQIQRPETMLPRLGVRLEYAFDRRRTLYGVQLEQPLVRPGRLAVGVMAVRRTDHVELQQVEDVENTLALLFARQDYHDYFEREGVSAYVSWRVPDFSTVSLNLRNDRFRSLDLVRGTRSFFLRDRDLRDNPGVDEGDVHDVVLRLEQLAHRTHRTRAGFYHWVSLERAGHGLGGDFDFTRLLADVRSVLRLSPSMSVSLRAVAGATPDGALPRQKQFTLGGVDGLRAHAFASGRGDQLALAQAEYTLGLWQLRSGMFEGGLHAIAFLDAGRAWSHPGGSWNIGDQRLECDGGFGVATSENSARVYFAKNLRDPSSDIVVSLRLQRPF